MTRPSPADLVIEDLLDIATEIGADAEAVLREWGVGVAPTPAERGAQTRKMNADLAQVAARYAGLSTAEIRASFGLQPAPQGD